MQHTQQQGRGGEAWYVPNPLPDFRPPGDDDYMPDGAGWRGAPRGQHFGGPAPEWNRAPPRAPPTPPRAAVPPAPQERQRKVILSTFWPNDVRGWFTWAEHNFRRFGVTDSLYKFALVLPTLPEDAQLQVRSLMREVDDLPDPYNSLKQRLLEIYTPPDLELTARILHAPELGDRKPSALMETLLSWLPAGEVDGLLFKTVFITRMPKEISDHLARKLRSKTSRELAALADQLWMARNARRSTYKAVAAVTPLEEDDDELADLTNTVAALNTGGKGKYKGKGQAKDKPKQKSPTFVDLKICSTHHRYGDKAFRCQDPNTCQWSGN